ncbi:MAG: BON domain-containing protein [Parcubacteria group bacterium]
MPNRDRWDYEREREDERQMRRRDPREEDRPDDFGQADYSTDYAYDPRTRTGYRTYDEYRQYGQADFREDYDYDPRTRTAQLRDDREEERRAYERARYRDDYDSRRERDYDHERRDLRRDERDRDYEPGREPRSWLDDARDSLAGMFGAGAGAAADRGPNRREQEAYRRERVIRAVICGRLDHDRDLDTSDIHVTVHGSEVTLDGTVRSREEKRRAEDLADVRGVTHVQNNLRIRQDRGWWR